MTMKTTSNDQGGCGQHELLVTVLYGEATESERTAFETHRAACAACDEEFAAFSQLRGTIGSWEVGALPAIRVEVRPPLIARLKQSFAILPMAMRVASATACALLVLALFNTELSVGQAGVSLHMSLVPGSVAQTTGVESAAAPAMTQEQVDRMIADRCDKVVEMRLATYRAEMDAQLSELQVRLASATSSDDVKRLTVQVAAQRKRIESLQKDLDRTAGYGGTDLFSAVLADQQPGS